MSPAKRVLDVTAAALGLVLLAPVLGLIGAAIRLVDGTPVFFRQERVGRWGRTFRIWKFRTMVADAERYGPLSVEHDPRVTVLGAWLRRHKLDELPQLLNVLVGEMSLVGPRPEVPRYVALYTAEQRRVLELLPGITDPASLDFVDEGELLARAADPEQVYVRELMPEKLRRNLDYAAGASVGTDVGVVLATVWRLAGRAGRPSTRQEYPHREAAMTSPIRRVAPVALLLLASPLAAQSAAAPPGDAAQPPSSSSPPASSPPASPPAGSGAAPVASVQPVVDPAAFNMTLRPGDVVRITVWRQPELSGDFLVAPDGSVRHPLYRSVRVAGMPVTEAERRITEFLRTYDQEPMVVVEPLLRVALGGEVRQPNLYSVPAGTTLSQAIALAGGVSERGRSEDVRLIRDGRETSVDLTNPARRGGDMPVQSGDQIMIGRRSNVWSTYIGPITGVTATLLSLAVAVGRL